MTQWLLRVSAYAERLLSGLDMVNWTDSLKEMQRNWIGRSEGAEIRFPVKGSKMELHIFTTRPDTIYGSTFMVLAPESELVERLTTAEQKTEVESYIAQAKKRTERERLSEVKNVSGVFTGSYAVHPFTGKDIPIWVSDYVLAGYGTGAIMAVPAHDSRDYAFAKHFGLPIVEVVSGGDISEASYDAKEGKLINSDFINDMDVPEAISTMCKAVEERGIGKAKVNYRLRDAIFSRQRYWGEPFPIYFENGIPKAMDESALPLELPQVDSFLPTAEGEPPLARAKDWKTPEGHPIETSTMPGFAGSSAYYFRYMDPKNDQALVSAEAQS
jgi:leucyl-tRNA synthetase